MLKHWWCLVVSCADYYQHWLTVRHQCLRCTQRNGMILSCRLVATHVLKVAPREEFSMAKPQFAKASPHKVHSHPPITAIRSASLSSLRQPHAEECRYGQRNSDFHAVRRKRCAGINNQNHLLINCAWAPHGARTENAKRISADAER